MRNTSHDAVLHMPKQYHEMQFFIIRRTHYRHLCLEEERFGYYGPVLDELLSSLRA